MKLISSITRQAELLEVADGVRELHVMVEEAKRDILEMTEAEGAFYMLGLLKEFNQLMGYAWKAERDLKEWFPPGKRHCINGVVLTLEKWSRL